MSARRWLDEAERLDVAAYAVVARADTPMLDRAMRRLSGAANYGRLWIGAAAILTLVGGAKGRRAAVDGLASIAVTSAVVNAALKPLGRRRRPDVIARGVPIARHVRMPISHSFPSGHSASAFAFAAGVAATQPATAVPLRALAGLVAYSRVHTGVHYPGDVLAGSLLGASIAQITTRLRERGRP
jgi:membrane-associated phospholipid phosphatase